MRIVVDRHRLRIRVPRRGESASRQPVAWRVPIVRVFCYVRYSPVTVERVRRDVPNGRQGPYEWHAILVRIRIDVRHAQSVSDSGRNVRHSGRVDRVRHRMFYDLLVRRFRVARDYWQNSKRNHRRVQVTS